MARILIVEDDAHTVAVLSLWLGQHGHDVVKTGNGVQALEALSQEPFDLIISDVNMPGMDGLELVKVVRSQRRLEVPFLMLSSRCDQTELAKQVESYGVVLYPKPFMPSRLMAQIDRLLGAVPT